FGPGELLLRSAGRAGRDGLRVRDEGTKDSLRPAAHLQGPRRVRGRDAARCDLWPEPLPYSWRARRGGRGGGGLQGRRLAREGVVTAGRCGYGVLAITTLAVVDRQSR